LFAFETEIKPFSIPQGCQMASHVIHQEKFLKIAQHEEPAFRAIIVGRDSLTGSLLADSLNHSLNCESVAIRHFDVLRTLETSKVDLVIVSADLNSIAGAGFDLASEISTAHPSIPIIILLDEPVIDLVIRAFLFGARGVFNPQDSMDEFIDCVEHVRKGSIWAGKEVTDYLLYAFRRIPAPGLLAKDPSSTLSTRELQVVQYAARGKTNKAIAGELHLSEHTVKNYLFKAFEKLGVSSRVELLFYLTVRGHSFGAPMKESVEVSTPVLMDDRARRPRASGE
jgi:two-component system nitrate/nitrite response regulator NarL